MRKIFLKHENDQNKTKPSYRKRTIFATITLALSLRFGKSCLSSSQSLSSNFDNKNNSKIGVNERDVNLFENND